MTSAAYFRVLDTVLTYGGRPLDQAKIATLSDTSDATVSNACRQRRGPYGPLLRGTPVGFSPEAGLVLAMSFGSESARAGLVDANGEIHCRHSAPPLRGQLQLSPDALFARIREPAILALDEAFQTPELQRSDGALPLLAAALAMPAPLDREHRLRPGALRHPGWDAPGNGVALTLNEHLAAALGDPFTDETAQVMNDCNAAAVAVAFDRVRTREPPREDAESPRRERTTALVVRVSGGVGAGMIEIDRDPELVHVSRFLKSRVMVGTNGLAGEIGHLPVSASAVDQLNSRSAKVTGLAPIDYAATCSCGGVHHLEALAGWDQLAQRIGLADDGASSLTEALERYLHPLPGQRHRAADRALEDAGRLIGRALTGTVLTLDPHSLTVLGALSVAPLIDGLTKARGEWEEAFWTGRTVAFDPPLQGSPFMSLRGAGLALLREHRHRRFREISEQRWDLVAPLLLYGREHLAALRAR